MADILEIMARGAFKSVRWSSFWSRDDAKELMRAALTALGEAGFAVVPVEPTQDMKARGTISYHTDDDINAFNCIGRVWKAMITASKPSEEL